MRIRNLTGVFTCNGFGRGVRPSIDGCGFIPGPAEIEQDAAGIIVYIGADRGDDKSAVDAKGLVATPAFIDSHTHSIFAGSRAHEHFTRWGAATDWYARTAQAGGGIHYTVRCTVEAPDYVLCNDLVRRLETAAASGIGAIEVKCGYAASAEGELRLLGIIREAACKVPQIRAHATYLALHALPPGRTEAEYVQEMIATLPEVRERRLADAVDCWPEKDFFSLDRCVEFAAAARQAGLNVRVHADELSDMGAAAAFAEIGALSADHLQHVSEAGIAALAAAGTAAVLLPATSFFLDLPYTNARRLMDAGCRVALASDFNPGSAPRFGLRLAIDLACSQYHMTGPEILCALTANAAAAMGLEESPALHVGGRWQPALWHTPIETQDSERLLQVLLLDSAPASACRQAQPLRSSPLNC